MKTIYGLRLKGSFELRYVGQTSLPIATRLMHHKARQPYSITPAFRSWLADNRAAVEAIRLSIVSDDVAREAEKSAIWLCLAMGHRLFNRQYVPTQRWIAPDTARQSRRPADAGQAAA